MLSISFILVIFIIVGMLALGAFTVLNNAHGRANRYFALMCLGLSAWIASNYLADAALNQAVLWTRFTFLSMTIAMVAFLLFTNVFPIVTFARRIYTTIFVTIAVIVGVICFLPAFIPGITIEAGVSNVQTGPLYPVFIVYLFGYLGLSLWLLVRKLKKSKKADQARIRFILLGITLMAIFVIPTNLVLPLILGQNDLAPYGTYFTLIFMGFTSYAIIRHRLFNIRRVVARSIAYILLLVSLAFIYGLLFYGVSAIFFTGNTIRVEQNVVSTVLAILLAFTFQPLRRFFERVTDRIFYRDRYDSQVVLNTFSSILVSELDLDRILKKSLASICESLHIQFGQVIVFNHDRVYRIEHFGPLPERLMVVPELGKLSRSLLVADELEGGVQKQLMDEHGIRVAMTLRTREQSIGHLLLGDKLSGDIYSTQDIDLLEIIGKELAVAILNAKAYAEIQEFNVTLQQRVDHATNRLRVANRHLKELDKAKDEFLSMASHQLRTPLTTIKGYLSMLLEGDAGKLTKNEKEFVDYAFTASERMVNLISDLLNVSRLSAGRFLIQTKPTDMVMMIADEVRQLQSHAAAKSIDLIFDPPSGTLPLVEIDENKTRQVVMNFIDNAIYYTKVGTVKVVLSQTATGVKLEVTDSGIGVPEEAKKKLFTKFFRADNAQTVRPDGTGLGLYLARRVVEDQGGTIIFNSTEGKGSTFGFELPLKATAPVTQ